MPFLKNTSFDDTLVRKTVIKFFEENFNTLLKETPRNEIN